MKWSIWNHFNYTHVCMYTYRLKSCMQECHSHAHNVLLWEPDGESTSSFAEVAVCVVFFLNVTKLAFLSWLVPLLIISVPNNNNNKQPWLTCSKWVLYLLNISHCYCFTWINLFSHHNNSMNHLLLSSLLFLRKLRYRGLNTLYQVN